MHNKTAGEEFLDKVDDLMEKAGLDTHGSRTDQIRFIGTLTEADLKRIIDV